MKISMLLLTIFFSINCYAGKLLPHVYITFEEETTSRSVTINFLSSRSGDNPSQVFFDEISHAGQVDNYLFIQNGRTGQINGVNKTYHHVKIDNLKPATTYYFVVGDEDIGFSTEYKFKTLPEDDSPIHIVTGGDMSTGSDIIDVSRAAVTEEPDVLVLGGDLAYANGKINNYYLWDKWLDNMDEVMMTPMGYLVPLIVAVGNHEVDTGVSIFGGKAPFYKEMFPQGGKSNFTRLLGANSVLFVLDSGHLQTHSRQKAWLEAEMQKYQHLQHRFAVYHAPLYPNHREYNDFLAMSGRSAWLKIFDKYNLTAAFENHDHTLKRTKVLKGNKVAQQGTIYVGDGCWGKSTRSANPGRWYLDVAKEQEHVWSVMIHPDHVNFMASSDEGVFDHFNLFNQGDTTEVVNLPLNL